MKLLHAILAAGSVLSILTAGNVRADNDWPAKPIRIVVPSAAGGSADFMARTFGQYLSKSINQPVVVDNRPGASAIIGAQVVKAAAPDGYTFLISGTSVSAANPVLFTGLSYDPSKDFVELGMFGLFPMIGMVRKGSPFHSVADIIAYAKAHPNKLSFGYHSASSRVPSELIKSRAGINVQGVAYKNITQISIDIASGLTDFAFMDAVSAAPAIQSGRLVPIAVTSPQRLRRMPDVPAVAEVLPGYEMQAWLGLAAPKGTPQPIIEKMSALLRDGLADPKVHDALEGQGLEVRATSLADMKKFVVADRARWVEWVRIAGITPITQ